MLGLLQNLSTLPWRETMVVSVPTAAAPGERRAACDRSASLAADDRPRADAEAGDGRVKAEAVE
jgi:hypothetical protein